MNLERNIEALVSKGQELIAYAITATQTPFIRHLGQYNTRAVVWFQGTFAGEKMGSENVAFFNKVLGNFAVILAINYLCEKALAARCLNRLEPVHKFIVRAVLLTSAVLISTAIFGGSLPVIGGITGVYLLAKTYGYTHKAGYDVGYDVGFRRGEQYARVENDGSDSASEADDESPAT